MLNPKQMPEIRSQNPVLFDLLREVTEAINTTGIYAGVDPRPAPHVPVSRALPAPKPPADITVEASAGLAFVRITPDATHNDLTCYVVEKSEFSDFRTYTRYFIGNARQGLFPFTGVSFWRSAAKLPMSPLSVYCVLSP